MFQNPQSMAIKKHIFDMIKEKYVKNEKFIERLTTYVTTKEDYESFGSLLVDVYEAGFMRALDQYKERWGLPIDYPVVSPNYAKRRSQIAKNTGLGINGRRRRNLKVVVGQHSDEGQNQMAILAQKS